MTLSALPRLALLFGILLLFCPQRARAVDGIQFAHQPMADAAVIDGVPNIAGMTFFADPRANPNFGFSHDRWWARTQVPTAMPPVAFLRWDAPIAQRIDAFLRCGLSPWHRLHRVTARYAVFDLGPAAAGCDVLVMQESHATIFFNLYFVSAQQAATLDDSTLVGLTIGVALAISGLGLALWGATRRPELPYFVMYQLSSVVVIVLAWGYVPGVIAFPYGGLKDFIGAGALVLWALGYFNYIRHVLRLREDRPRLNRALNLLPASMAFGMALQPWHFRVIDTLLLLSLIAANGCYWVVVVAQWRRQRRRSLEQLIGFLPSLVSYAEFLRYIAGDAPLAAMRDTFLLGQMGTALTLGLWITLDFKRERDAREARLSLTVDQLRANGEELAQYQSDLESLVVMRTAELQRALSEERAIVEQQRDFTAMIGHEFRTPLAVIDGQARRIGRSSVAPDDLSRRSREIREAVRDMIGLMDGLLFHARHESGATAYHFETMDVDETLQFAVEMALPPERMQDLNLAQMPAAAWQADRTLLVSAIGNIIGNAAKYSSPGTPITISVSVAENMAELLIADRGVGIAPAELGTVFARFQRGSNVLTTAGTGLGLFIARQIIEGHGGTIDVRSVLGEGTCFTVRIPAMVPVASAAVLADSPR